MATNVDFDHLAESPEFAAFTAILKKLTGVVMALNEPASGKLRLKFKEGEDNPVCRLIRADAVGLRRCTACDHRHHSRAETSGRAQLYTCHAGFWDIAVPVFVFGRHVATISSGQLLREPRSPGAFRRLRRRLDWLKVADHDLRAAYEGAPYLPREQIACVMQLLELFARQLCESAQRIRDLQAQLERVEVRRAREFVEREFRNPSLALGEAAGHAGLSPAHFSHVFRQTTGTSFTRFVQARRVAEAKKQLAETQDSITNICFVCGFNSLTHFNRVFRAFERHSPTQHRQARLSQVPAPNRRALPGADRD
ncbi:MAG: PocR ligand-binding domain-containing protein [Verrucomicrobia bacterium]|nr:PocR ligand-binding domain-containing protein [Verrucomicrobiota bacterium]